MILNCSCNHEGQDKLYGKGRRVFNETKKPDTYRCTVCKVEKTHKESIKDSDPALK